MDVSAEKLCGLFYRAFEHSHREPRPPFLKLFHGIPIGQHIDHLGNPDAGAFNSELTACPVGTGLKIFVCHSMSIVASRLGKVNSAVTIESVFARFLQLASSPQGSHCGDSSPLPRPPTSPSSQPGKTATGVVTARAQIYPD